MKVLIATGGFFRSLSGVEAADCILQGILRVLPEVEVELLPLADGGEGTVEVLHRALGGQLRYQQVAGPAGKAVGAPLGLLPEGVGVLEATACDLRDLRGPQGSPLRTGTGGVGQMIRSLLDHGCRSILAGLGDVVAGDGGMGMARALGVRFLDRAGEELHWPGQLEQLERMDLSGLDGRLTKLKLSILTDSRAQLCGEQGVAARIRQAGLRLEHTDREVLENGLRRLAQVVRGQLGIDLAEQPGMGAAGGLAYGLGVFCGGRIRAGSQDILERVGLQQQLQGCDLVLTGEGDLTQAPYRTGVCVAVAKQAQAAGVPVLVLSSSLNSRLPELQRLGLENIVTILNRPMHRADAVDEAETLLRDGAERAIRLLLAGKQLALQGVFL